LRTKGIVIAIGLAIAAAALPTAAGAKLRFIGEFENGPSRSAEFKLKGSNGYSISVSGTIGQPKPVRPVTLTARNSDGASVTYLAQGVATEKRIEASFGALGHISVRFHPSQPPHFVQRAANCRGSGELVHAGNFIGTIAFEGEQGYTTLHASRAKGIVTQSFKEVCSEGGEGHASHPPPISLTMLDATSRSTPGYTSFDALRVVSKPRPQGFGGLCSFLASIFEVQPPLKPGGRPALAIIRSIHATAKPSAFSTTASGAEITSASIAPPVPFTGAATYVKGQGSRGSWSGSLAANFPGLGEVSLAGPEFSARISEPLAQGGSSRSVTVRAVPKHG